MQASTQYEQEKNKKLWPHNEVDAMKILTHLLSIHQSTTVLIDQLLTEPEFRKNVPRLSQAEHIADTMLVRFHQKDLHGKTQANGTARQVLP